MRKGQNRRTNMVVFPRAANALVKVLMLTSSTRAFTSRCFRSSSSISQRGVLSNNFNALYYYKNNNNEYFFRQQQRDLSSSSSQGMFHSSMIPWWLMSSSSNSVTKRFMTSSSSVQDSVVSTCRNKICAALETDQVKVTGKNDDPNGSHISIEVVSSMFEGKRSMQRQQMVYKAIWNEMQGAVHAVDSMVCKTPGEA